jgi:hypothetical protein
MESKTQLKGIEKRLENLADQRQKKSYLKEVYKSLKQGMIYDWEFEDLCRLFHILAEHGLDVEELDIGYVAKRNPEYWREGCKYFPDLCLSEKEMEQLSRASEEEVFEKLFNANTFHGLGILPQYQTQATRKLEEELFLTVESYTPINQTVKHKPLLELRKFGPDFYTTVQDSGSKSTELFKVNKITQIKGPHFVAVRSYGYHAIAHYTPEDIARVAPPEANSFLEGTIMLVRVYCGGIRSPIVLGNVLRPVHQEEGDYHIIPVKFYHCEVDTSKRYRIDFVEHNYETISEIREVVKPIDRDEIVSKSDKVLLTYH